MRPEAAVAVSVILPFRDAAEDLPGALEGLALLRGDVEILLVDDASTDSGPALARDYCARDPRARLIRRDRAGGPTLARMTGVRAARGEYVWFCDADDDWDPGIVVALLAEARAHRADIVACRAERLEADGRRWVMEGVRRARTVAGAGIPRLLWTGTMRGYLWNKLLRREIIPEPRRTPLSSQDDLLMLLDVLESARVVRLIPGVHYRYRERAGSVSGGARPSLENLHRCGAEAARRLAALDARAAAPGRFGRARAEAFAIWFLLVPAISTPVHRDWPRGEAERVRRALAPGLGARGIAALAPAQPSVAAHAALIRLAGSRYAGAYRLARRATGLLRRLPGTPRRGVPLGGSPGVPRGSEDPPRSSASTSS